MFLISVFRPNGKNGRMPKATYLLILVIAAAVAATLAYSAFLATLPSQLLQIIESADQIKIQVTLAQIGEEAGHAAALKPSETDVWSHYDRADDLVTFLLSNGRNTLSRMDTPEFENLLLLTREQISRCRQVTERRFLFRGGPDTMADVNRQINTELSRLLSLADEIHVEAGIVARETIAHFQRLQYLLILASVMLAALAGGVILRFDLRRASDFNTIRSQNQQLEATEQQLRASNQQLRASNQQLQAADQQLRASNQQLQASEQALRASEGRYRALFANMSEGMALFSAVYNEAGKPVDYRIEDVNRQFEDIFSVARNSVVGRLVSEASGTALPIGFAEYRQVAETGRPAIFERNFPALGRDFRICVYSPEQGSCAAVFMDITDRKEAAAAHRRESVRLETLMQIANFKVSDMKEFLDHALGKTLRMLECGTGFICDYNENAHTFTPRSFKTDRDNTAAQEWLGRSAQLLAQAVQQAEPLVLNDYAAGEDGGEQRNGQKRLLIVPIMRQGRPVAVACVTDRETGFQDHDATEFALLMDSVWKIVDLRREQEERSRLETRIQKLESVGVLAGGIAHDFNNLLTAILANVSLAKLQAREGEAITTIGTRLSEIETACTRAQDLTQQLLTFAKGGKPVKKLVRLEPVIRDAASLAVTGTNVHCRFRIADDLCCAEVDTGQISQAISNLVINAVQAMPAGGTVTIEAKNSSPDHSGPVPAGQYVRISVIDKGIGIVPEHLDRIFDPYFTTKQKGSGLGLTVSHSVIAGHNGHIAVQSRIGAGTSFHVYLPASADAVPQPVETKHQHVPGRGQVLIMDDEEMVRTICGEILKKLGYRVHCVRDGREAVARYEKQLNAGKPFDAVILDLTVPDGMGGREAVREILRIHPEAKVLVSSGYSNDPVMADFKSYGFCGLIAKPYTMQSLSEAVNGIIDDGKAGPGQYQH